MYQSIELIGRLGKDPEERYTPDGTAVTHFNLAVDGSQGKTIWVRIVTWDNLAKICGKYLIKGSLVHVVGTLTPDKETGNPRMFQRKNGEWACGYEVTAKTVTFLSPRSGEASEASQDNYEDLF